MIGATENIASKAHSITDLGGRNVLNMGGSLTGYINTGNPYNKDYFQRSSTYRNKNIQKKESTAHKQARIAKKFLKFSLGALAGVLALSVGKAKCKKLFDKFKNSSFNLFKKTTSDANPEKVKKILSRNA